MPRPSVQVAADILDGSVPAMTLADAVDYVASRDEIARAARALAYRLRPDNASTPIDVTITTVSGEGVDEFHYHLEPDLISLSRDPFGPSRVTVTMQRPVDLILMENGVSLMTVVASGRASLTGTLEELLGIFGDADYAATPGRRSFPELSALLRTAHRASPREVPGILDSFGRSDFALELVSFFAEAALLSGIPRDLPPAQIMFNIGHHKYLCAISSSDAQVRPLADGDTYEASIEVLKMETMVDRLLGRVGDMDAILSRRMLVAGPAVDDLMPLFERISTGLTVFTSADETDREWSFPPAL